MGTIEMGDSTRARLDAIARMQLETAMTLALNGVELGQVDALELASAILRAMEKAHKA